MNTSTNILAAILVNVAITCEFQDLGDHDRAAQCHMVWEGLQAAFAYVCNAEGITRKIARRRYAKTARTMAIKMGAPRKWLPTVPQIAA